LRLGEIVYDGPPTDLTPEVLTKIYGEEDWSATIHKVDEDGEGTEAASNVISLESRQPHRDRMAGLT
jgi:phosphonate transport system ATP-binding protein